MREWKEKARYSYPSCQILTLQRAEGTRFRLKVEVTDIGSHQRYNDAASQTLGCSIPTTTGFFYVLHVKPKSKIPMRKQFLPLNRDYCAVFPLMHGKDGQGADLIAVAKLCEMTPLGSVTKVYHPKETNNGQESNAQTPARVEAGGQANTAQAAEGIRDGQDRAIRESIAAPQAVQHPGGGDRSISIHSWSATDGTGNANAYPCPTCPGGNCVEPMVNHDERRCSRCRPHPRATFTVAS